MTVKILASPKDSSLLLLGTIRDLTGSTEKPNTTEEEKSCEERPLLLIAYRLTPAADARRSLMSREVQCLENTTYFNRRQSHWVLIS